MDNDKEIKALKELFEAKIESVNKEFDARVKALNELFDTRIKAQDKETAIAHKTLNKRLEGMNEFRDALKDQAGKFITRTELDLILERIKEDKRADIALGISLLGILIAVITLFLKH